MSNTSTRRRLIAAIDEYRRSLAGRSHDYIEGYNETFDTLKFAASRAAGIDGAQAIYEISFIIKKIATLGFVEADRKDIAKVEYLLGASHAAANVKQAIILEDII